MDFWFGVFVGFLASVLGSLLMWLVVGNWIVQRRVEKEIVAFKEGKYDDVLEAAFVKLLYIAKDDEIVSKFIKDYFNGLSMAFVNIVCNRFGIAPAELKELVKGSGAVVDEQGNIDFMATLMKKVPMILDKVVDNAIDEFTG